MATVYLIVNELLWNTLFKITLVTFQYGPKKNYENVCKTSDNPYTPLQSECIYECKKNSYKNIINPF